MAVLDRTDPSQRDLSPEAMSRTALGQGVNMALSGSGCVALGQSLAVSGLLWTEPMEPELGSGAGKVDRPHLVQGKLRPRDKDLAEALWGVTSRVKGRAGRALKPDDLVCDLASPVTPKLPPGHL